MTRFPRRSRAAAVVVVTAAAALSACGPNQLGAAAIVGDERITVSEVQQTLESLREARELYGLPAELGENAARVEVERRLFVEILERAAAEAGVVATPGEIAAARAELVAQYPSETELARAAAEQGVTLAILEDLNRTQVLGQELQDQISGQSPGLTPEALNMRLSQRVVDAARGMKITVNPRYGSFSVDRFFAADGGAIAPTEFDFLRTL